MTTTTIPLAWLARVGLTRDHIAPACLVATQGYRWLVYFDEPGLPGRHVTAPTEEAALATVPGGWSALRGDPQHDAIDLTRPGGMDAAARGLAVALDLASIAFRVGDSAPRWIPKQGQSFEWGLYLNRGARFVSVGDDIGHPCEALAAAWASVAAERGWA